LLAEARRERYLEDVDDGVKESDGVTLGVLEKEMLCEEDSECESDPLEDTD